MSAPVIHSSKLKDYQRGQPPLGTGQLISDCQKPPYEVAKQLADGLNVGRGS